jgi:hypothetical protein
LSLKLNSILTDRRYPLRRAREATTTEFGLVPQGAQQAHGRLCAGRDAAGSSDCAPGGSAKGGTLATRIKSLREQLAGKELDQLETYLTRLQELNALRTDLVHGTLGLIDHDGERYAVFSNARDAAKLGRELIKLAKMGGG